MNWQGVACCQRVELRPKASSYLLFRRTDGFHDTLSTHLMECLYLKGAFDTPK
jgi:hypothetical protein